MKKITALLLAICMMLALVSCDNSGNNDIGNVGNSEGIASTAPAPTTVTMSVPMDNTTFDPVQSLSMGCLYNRQVFETLVREESNGELVAGLAESWEMSDDNLSIDFQLREGVKFHNGDTMTAEDVAFSLNRAISDSLMDFTVYMDGAEVIDDTHVRLNMKSVYSDVLSALAVVNMGIVSKRAVEELGDSFGTAPVGTGPYTLSSWKTGSSMVFTAFPDYWRGEAAIKEVTLLVQPDASTGAIALESGEVDVLGAVLAGDVENLESVDGITVYKTTAVSTTTLYLNCAGGVTQDPRVRQAIALCLNKDDFCMGVLNGLGQPADTIVPESLPYHNPDIKAPERNIEEAKKLLADAGYPDGITVKYATVAEAPDLVQVGNILLGQLAEAGITLKIDVKEYSAWFNDVQTNHDFDITCAATTTNASTPGSVLSNILVSGAVNNLGQYKNDEVEQNLAKANGSFEESEKQACYDRVNELVIEDCPIIPLFTGYTIMAAKSNLAGFVCPAVNTMYFYDWSWSN